MNLEINISILQLVFIILILILNSSFLIVNLFWGYSSPPRRMGERPDWIGKVRSSNNKIKKY